MEVTSLAATLRILIVLPQTRNLFKYLKQRYSRSQIGELNSTLKWRSRRISLREKIVYFQRCLDHSVLPRHIYEKVKKLRPRFTSSVGRAFVKSEIDVLQEDLERATRFYKRSFQQISNFLSFFDWIRVSKLLGENGRRIRGNLRKEYIEKLKWQRKQRFGSEELNFASICNLSSIELTVTQMEVLSRGPKFGIPPVVISKEEILSEFELLYNQVESSLSISSLPPLISSERKDAFRAKIATLAQDYCNVKQNKLRFPLGKEHLEAIRELKANDKIVITRPDKGAGIVLMDRVDYVRKMMEILNDTSKFEYIGKCEVCDKTDQNEKALQAFLYRQLKGKKISQVIYDRIRPSGSVRPRMYGLPKVHKGEPVPLRPILSLAGSAQHELARWLAELLEPVLERFSFHCVKDSFSFCDVLRQHGEPGKSAFMCSFDVKSLFTNIPLDETITVCLDTLYRCDDISPPCIEETLLNKLLIRCTRDVEFSFDGCMYRQVDGVAMGSPLGPILANIFLGYCESRISDNMWPDLYRRYVDDTFSLFMKGKEDALKFLNCLNSLHPSLQFTMESEADRKLPFLDVLVFRDDHHFSTTVYRKPTFTGLYTRWDSYCATGRKIALIRSLTVRAKRICSHEHLQNEITNLKSIFEKNGYPPGIINRIIEQTMNPRPPVLTAAPKLVHLRLPWVGVLSSSVQNQIGNAMRKATPWCRLACCFTSRNAFRTFLKDALPMTDLSNVIYLFNCDCGSSYIGRTTLRLCTRMKQHIPTEIIQQDCSSAVVKRGRGRPRKNASPLALQQKDVCTDSVSARTRSKLFRSQDAPVQATSSMVDASVSTEVVNGASDNKMLTAITRHLIDSPPCLKAVSCKLPECFKVLSRARNLQHLKTLEAIYIKLRKPDLCIQKEHVIRVCLV